MSEQTSAIFEEIQGGVQEGVETVILGLDWVSPTGQILGLLAGHEAVLGWAWEIKKLEKYGIPCHFPMKVNDPQGEYMWQVSRANYKRAQRILSGGKR